MKPDIAKLTDWIDHVAMMVPPSVSPACQALRNELSWEKFGGITEFLTKPAALEHKATLLAMGHKMVKVWSVTMKEIDE